MFLPIRMSRISVATLKFKFSGYAKESRSPFHFEGDFSEIIRFRLIGVS